MRQRTSFHRPWSFGLVAGLLVVGCFQADDSGGGCTPVGSARGLTGNGGFVLCDDVDHPCNGWGSVAPVAVGANFHLTYDRNQADAGSGKVDVVSTKAVTRDGDHFVVNHSGRVGFVVADGESMVDAFRLHAIEATKLRLHGRLEEWGDTDVWSDPKLTPFRIDEKRLYVEMPDEGLLGSLLVHWSVDDPSIVDVENLPNGAISVTGRRKGKTHLRAAWRGLTDVVEIVVSDGIWETDAGVEVDADASDAGASDANASDDAAKGDQ